MKNILVTGGAGFIGSHTCLILLEKGYTVYVIDSFVNSSPKSLERINEICKLKNIIFNQRLKVFEGDLRDKYFIKKVFSEINKNEKKIDGVIHFAGLKAVAESIRKPMMYWENNVLGTINLLKIMDEFDCKTLVFSSSASIYSQKGNELLKENFKLKPVNPYGNTKLNIELILNDLFQASKIGRKYASLRYFNPIGAHSSGLIGENPIGKPNNIFPLIVNTASGIQNVLTIYGNDWPTKDGTTVRDYIHVMDLAEAHIHILEDLFNHKSVFLKINIGTGKGTTVLELVKTFEKVNNLKVPYVFSQRRPGDVCHVVADNSYLESQFEIFPKRNIEEMCLDGWKFRKLNPKGF